MTTDVLRDSNIPAGLSDREFVPSVIGTTMESRDFLSGHVQTHRIEISFRGGRLILEAEEPVLDWYVPVCRKLAGLLDLPRNWDSYNAPPIESQAIGRVLHILEEAIDLDMPRPAVVPTVKGGVQLEWHTNGLDLEIEIEPDSGGSIFYEHEKGDIIEREGNPEDHLSLIQELVIQLKP